MRTSRRFVVPFAIMIATWAISSAQVRTADEQEVLQSDTDRFDAMVKADVTALDRLLAPEVNIIHSHARIDDKEAFIFEIKSGSTKYQKIIPTERKARVMGTLAIVTGVAAMRGVERGQNLDVTVRYTGVHAKRDGRWLLVAWQATRLIPSDKVIPGGPA
jgi:ketosteroid isomerase-like protein